MLTNRLNISPGTAKLHLHQIYRKLNLSGRLALMLYARDNGLKVIPTCPFMAGWVKKHPEQHDIVDESCRETLGLA